MTLEQLLAGIPDAPLQRAVVRLQLAVVGSSGGDSGFFFATVVYVALHVGLMPALAWVGNWYYGLFGTRQLVAMTVGYVVQDALWEVALLRGRAFARKEEKVLVGTLQERLALDNHLLAGVARYRLLLEDSSDPEAASGELARSLLRHEPGDPLCSCPKAGCAGWHLRGHLLLDRSGDVPGIHVELSLGCRSRGVLGRLLRPLRVLRRGSLQRRHVQRGGLRAGDAAPAPRDEALPGRANRADGSPGGGFRTAGQAGCRIRAVRRAPRGSRGGVELEALGIGKQPLRRHHGIPGGLCRHCHRDGRSRSISACLPPRRPSQLTPSLRRPSSLLLPASPPPSSPPSSSTRP
ncbi:hypothetical protein DFJ74DRAFT_652906 [Hyaloraphidium curvatum]|nr:hypothetical protein DFJ74DRAFT_652906 [Hyaloraphidium curvatum]